MALTFFPSHRSFPFAYLLFYGYLIKLLKYLPSFHPTQYQIYIHQLDVEFAGLSPIHPIAGILLDSKIGYYHTTYQ